MRGLTIPNSTPPEASVIPCDRKSEIQKELNHILLEKVGRIFLGSLPCLICLAAGIAVAAIVTNPIGMLWIPIIILFGPGILALLVCKPYIANEAKFEELVKKEKKLDNELASIVKLAREAEEKKRKEAALIVWNEIEEKWKPYPLLNPRVDSF